jgi:hypothetical protein
MSILKIDDKDILWKYYQKTYTLDDCKVRPPSDFCHYFWCGLWGMVRSLYYEASLWLLWLITLGSLGLSIYVAYLVCTNFDDPSGWLKVPPLILCTASLIANIMAIFISAERSKWFDWAGKISSLLMVVCGVGLIGYMAIDYIISLDSWGWVQHVVVAIGYMVGYMVVFTAITLVITSALIGLAFLLIHFIFTPMSTCRFLQAFWTYLISAKRRVCPLVELPASFIESQRAEEMLKE